MLMQIKVTVAQNLCKKKDNKKWNFLFFQGYWASTRGSVARCCSSVEFLPSDWTEILPRPGPGDMPSRTGSTRGKLAKELPNESGICWVKYSFN